MRIIELLRGVSLSKVNVHTATIRIADSPADIDQARTLIVEYSRTLGEDFCLLGFDKELAALGQMYGHPGGVLLLAFDEGTPVGCIAYRAHGEGVCEMKRLYVRPSARGHKLGRRLTEDLVAHARAAGYRRMILDTLPTLQAAVSLYRTLGFVETPPYYDNPIPGVVYMALEL